MKLHAFPQFLSDWFDITESLMKTENCSNFPLLYVVERLSLNFTIYDKDQERPNVQYDCYIVIK